VEFDFGKTDWAKPSQELTLGQPFGFALTATLRARLRAIEMLLMLLADSRFKLCRHQLGSLITGSFNLAELEIFGRSIGAIFLNRNQLG